MHELSAIALFCDDIREEKSGAHTIIGIMGDNIIVPGFPGAVPKLAIYVRLHIPVETAPEEYRILFNFPNGERVLINTIEHDLIKNTIRDAKKAKNKIAGIFSQLIASPFPVERAGRIEVELEWSGGKMFIGGLNFIEAESTTSVTSP